MEAQKCKLCGARHHRYEPHVFAEGTKLIPLSAEMSYDNKRGPGVAVIPAPSKSNTKTGRPSKSNYLNEAGYFDRNAYQREYMKRRRAKAKQ